MFIKDYFPTAGSHDVDSRRSLFNCACFTKLQLKVSQTIAHFYFNWLGWHAVFDVTGILSMNSSSSMYKDNIPAVNYKAITQFKYYLAIYLKLSQRKWEKWKTRCSTLFVPLPERIVVRLWWYLFIYLFIEGPKLCPKTWVKFQCWFSSILSIFNIWFNMLPKLNRNDCLQVLFHLVSKFTFHISWPWGTKSQCVLVFIMHLDHRLYYVTFEHFCLWFLFIFLIWRLPQCWMK